MLRSAIYCIVVFFFVAARPHDPSRISVCIVGGGIGGGAVSYFLRNRSDISVEVFESRSEVGGRLKHIDVDGFIVEVGGDAWSSANEYVVQIVKVSCFDLFFRVYAHSKPFYSFDGASHFTRT